jgi:serine/threonine protein kinase
MGPERGQHGRASPARALGRDDSSVVVLLGDLRARFGRGEPARVEEYLARHPSLADDPDGVLDLIYQEIVLRAEHGEAPRIDEYRRRFPHLSDPLSDLFEVHDALEATDLATPHGTGSGAPTAVAGDTEPSQPAPRPSDAVWPELEGYEIQGVLGRGGMGVVYRAFDRRRGSVVALKTMQRVDSETLYRFKQEFRALRDVAHPNLVNLYELVSDGPHWFITMELIEGTTFLNHVRDAPSVAPANRPAVESLSTPPATCEPDVAVSGERTARDPALAPEPARPPDEARPPALDNDRLAPEGLRRLRAAVRQLAEGVAALHAAGKMHRDIKPSNVLVERGGRVVLTDFGLATEPEPADHNRSREGLLVGTAAYMAPEQAAGRPPTPAADWYSVGVVLFEALAGRRPFVGTALQVLLDKQSGEPPPPSAFVPDVPADLDALCLGLLRRDPDARPSGADVLARLGAEAAEPPSGSSRPGASSAGEIPLIGRAPHRQALDEAFARVQGGRTVVLGVRGRSGLGKSALVQQFLDDLAQREAAVVLAGRCHESESVPYKALDSLIDALTRYLRRLPPSEVDALLPRDVGPLVRVFPVLRRVESIDAAPRRIAEAPDLQELRRRAFAALRELLARLGDRRPLVLAIDDLQWADADSLAAFAEVLRPPDPPVLLLVGCYRSEADAPGPLPAATLVSGGGPDDPVERRELAVEPLEPAEARELALALLDPAGPTAEAGAEAIARESGGNPLFVAELVRAAQGGGIDGSERAAGALTLEDVLWSRIERLPEPARRLLEVVAVAGHPVRPELAWRSLGIGGDERGALGVLRAGRLVRGTPGGDPPAVEAYHDRVRETVLGRLQPGDLRGHHRRLAEALDAAGGAEPEVLGVHFEGAGALDRAAVHYAAAAGRAAEALAFERAAAFYRLALELQPDAAAAGTRALRTGLADALANAGRGAEAARAYLSAADGAGDAEAFELRRRAALQYLISGHIDAGLDALRGVLRAVGLRLPETPRRALLSLLLGRARMAVRGLRFQARDASAVPHAELARIDACWTAGVGLSVVDWIRGADFQTQGLRLALRAGEPYRIARALALEAAHSATAGQRAAARTARRLAQAEELAGRTGHPYALGMATLARGVSAYLEGRWRDALDGCDAAEVLFRDGCTGVAWERDTAHAFALWALSHLGAVAELARRFPILQQSARERGDLYALANLGTYNQSVVRLAADEPEPAREAIREQMAQWSRQGFHVQHNDQLWGAVHIELYRGDGPAAWAVIERHWPALAGSLLLRVQFVRVSMTALRARAALASASARSDPRPLTARAARDARRLARERVPWAIAHARLVEGLLEAARGRSEAAARALADAAARYDAAEMALCAAAARRRLGALLGGDEGRSLVQAADARMAAQGVRNPARLAAMYAPGTDRWEPS